MDTLYLTKEARIYNGVTGSSLLTGPEGLLAKERENLKRLKCLRRYRQRYGVEALLHRQLKERRMLATDGAAQQVICVYTSKVYTFAFTELR